MSIQMYNKLHIFDLCGHEFPPLALKNNLWNKIIDELTSWFIFSYDKQNKQNKEKHKETISSGAYFLFSSNFVK